MLAMKPPTSRENLAANVSEPEVSFFKLQDQGVEFNNLVQ